MAQNSRTLAPHSWFVFCFLLTACAPKKELSSDLLSTLGDKATAQYDAKGAEDMYVRALKTQPHNHAVRLKLLRLYLDQKRYQDIIAHTNNIDISLDNIDACRLRGISFDLAGEHTKAQETYLRILKIFPADEKSHLNLILSYLLSHNTKFAKAHIISCREKLPAEYHPKLDELQRLCDTASE